MDKEKRRKRSMAFFMVAIVLIFWNLMQNMSQQQLVKVACIGDSITFGTNLPNREKECYPVKLLDLLGTDSYRVGNFGVEGATLQKETNHSYWESDRLEQSLSYEANVVILLLGANDITSTYWTTEKNFKKDYQALIKTYQESSAKPVVFLCTLPMNNLSDTSTHIAIANQVITDLAKENNLPLIDLADHTADHPDWYLKDGIHPNAKGAEEIAKAVNTAIQNYITTNK